MKPTLSKECIDDMLEIVKTGKWSLDAQLRSYAFLEMIQDNGCCLEETAAFLAQYASCSQTLDEIFDAEALKAEAAERLRPLEEELEEARFKAASAASLHEFAKEVFQIWQTEGVFMRRRALRELRQRAGFRLESHRIGNYVAKTYDLMEEARRSFQKAQQSVYEANIQYKCSSNIYKSVAGILSEQMAQ